MAAVGVTEASGLTGYDQNLASRHRGAGRRRRTPFYLGAIGSIAAGRMSRSWTSIATIDSAPNVEMQDLTFALGDTTLRVSRDGSVVVEIDLRPWFETSKPFLLANPAIDLRRSRVGAYRLLADSIALVTRADGEGSGAAVSSIYGQLFAGPIPPAPPPAAEPTAPDQPAPAT